MPDEGVKCQRPVFVHDAGGLYECHNSAEQIEGRHKVKHTALYFTCFDQRSENTKIHRNAAELEGEDPPLIVSVSDMIVIEKLLIDFRDDKKHTYTEKDRAVTSLADVAQFSRKKNADQNADCRKDQMKGTVRFRFFHRPRGRVHKLRKPLTEIVHTVLHSAACGGTNQNCGPTRI